MARMDYHTTLFLCGRNYFLLSNLADGLASLW